MSESTPNIPLLPEDQARLDKLVTELWEAHAENELNVFVVDLPTAEWVRDHVTQEQWDHVFDVAEAENPDGPTSGAFAVDLGDGFVLGTFADIPLPIILVEVKADELGARLIRFSDPVTDVPETFAA